jgi:hypothetical protein
MDVLRNNAVVVTLGLICCLMGLKVIEYKGKADLAQGNYCGDSGGQAYDLFKLDACTSLLCLDCSATCFPLGPTPVP